MVPFRYIFLLFAIFAISVAAPSEESSSDKKDVEISKRADEKASTNTAVAVESWEKWMSTNSMNILVTTLGTIFMIGGLAMAGYYYVYLNYFAYNAAGETNYPYYTGASPAYQNAAPYSYARSLDASPPQWNFSWGQVMYMLSLAQESYDKFDFQSLDCQKKTLCELVQKQTDFGETGRKISNTFSILDVVEGLPMPSLIQSYMREYKEALEQGKNSSKECGTVYPECRFSLKEVLAKYRKRAASGKF